MDIRANLMNYANGPKKSVTAKITLESLENFAKAEFLIENYKTGFEDAIITFIANSFRPGLSTCFPQVETIKEDAKPLLDKVLQKIQNRSKCPCLDKSARMVKIFIYHSTYSPESIAYSDECIEKYPEETYFYINKLNMLFDMENLRYEKAMDAAEIFPNDTEILFHCFNGYFFVISDEFKANNFEYGFFLEKMKKLKEWSRKFLAVTPEDHPLVPLIYFQLSSLYRSYFKNEEKKSKETGKNELVIDLSSEAFLNLKKYYEKGLRAEEAQIPDYNLNDNKFREIYKNEIGGFLKITSKFLPKSKDYGGQISMSRLRIVKSHRAHIKAHKRALKNLNLQFEKNPNEVETQVKAELEQIRVQSLAGLNKIDLEDVDIMKEHTYNRNYIEFLIVEDPDILGDTIMLVGQEGLTFHRIAIKNFDKNKNIYQFLGFGCKIAITNPHLKIFEEGAWGVILVEDQKTLILSGEKDLKRCRWCGESNTDLSCAKCKRKYCKKECQVVDWQVLDHKLICGKPFGQ